MKINAQMYNADGALPCAFKEKYVSDGVTAVTVSAKSDTALDALCAVKLSLIPDNTFSEYTAVYRHSEYWCRPQFGESLKTVPDETQTLILKNSDGSYTAILPVVSELYRCVIEPGNTKNEFCARLFTYADGLTECNALSLVYKTGDNPFSVMHDCVNAAINELGNKILPAEQRKYPEIFEYLGWCSWDALHIEVNERGLLEKCKEFKEKNLPVRWAILDDMWADVPNFKNHAYSDFGEMIKLMHSSSLRSIEADPERFPDGLKHTVTEMKKYLTWIGMWHPTTGYWFGIEPGSKLFEKYKDHLYKTADGRYILKPDYESYHAFLDEWHAFFRDCGADFVKLDNQSIIRQFYKHTRPIGKIAHDMHAAIEQSAEKYFDGALINCMGCANDNIWNRPSSAVSRCSDDFQPNNREWFTKHILQCSFASFMQRDIITCDWDMWWTNDPQGIKNSVIRAVSGGPIYISDEIGKSERNVIMPLILSDGKILRCDKPAVPTADCLTGNPETNGRIFKLQNTAKGSGVLAVFNIDASDGAARGSISPDDIDGLCGEEFAVYEHFTKQAFTVKKGQRIPLTLETRDNFRLYNFVPIKDGFAALGDVSKFICPLTVKSADKNSGAETLEHTDCLIFRDGKFVAVKA